MATTLLFMFILGGGETKFPRSKYQDKVCPCRGARTNARKLEVARFEGVKGDLNMLEVNYVALPFFYSDIPLSSLSSHLHALHH